MNVIRCAVNSKKNIILISSAPHLTFISPAQPQSISKRSTILHLDIYKIVQSTWALSTSERAHVNAIVWKLSSGWQRANSVHDTFPFGGTSAFQIQCKRRIFIAFYLNCIRSSLMRFRHFICASLFKSKAFKHRKFHGIRCEPHTIREFSATNTIEMPDCHLIHFNILLLCRITLHGFHLALAKWITFLIKRNHSICRWWECRPIKMQ